MKDYVIIGNSAAGISAAEAIRKLDSENNITIISDENYPAYCRCMISYLLAGEITEDKLKLRPDDFYKQNKIKILLAKKVIKVDTNKDKLILDDKTQLSYDLLLIATGGKPTIPDTKGMTKQGVFGLRTLADVKSINEFLPISQHCVVLGGGLVGLKAANAFKKRRKEVKVIVKSNRVLSQMLDLPAAEMIRSRLKDNNIEVITGADVSEVIGNGDIKAVKLDTGKVYAAEILVVGKGVVPNIKLIEDSKIKINTGILVDQFLQTNLENVFAAGDVCEAKDAITGENGINALWPNAIEQGRIAGTNMARKMIGESLTRYDGSVGMNSIEFFGLPVISMGIVRGKKEDGFEEIVRAEPANELYKKIVIKDNRLVGMIYLGKIEQSGLLLKLIKNKLDISPIKDDILTDTFNYANIIKYLQDAELSVADRMFKELI